MKIMKTIEYQKRINKNHENLRIPCQNHENHENLKISLEIHKNLKQNRIPKEN